MKLNELRDNDGAAKKPMRICRDHVPKQASLSQFPRKAVANGSDFDQEFAHHPCRRPLQLTAQRLKNTDIQHSRFSAFQKRLGGLRLGWRSQFQSRVRQTRQRCQ